MALPEGAPGSHFWKISLGQARTNLRFHERPACEQGAIGHGKEHRAVVIDAEAFEELVEIRHLDPGHQHAQELAILVVYPLGQRNDPLAVLATANRRADVRLRRNVLLVKLEVVTIRHALATGQVFERRHHPLPLAVEQENAVQLIQRRHSPGEGPLQPWHLRSAVAVSLNPVGQAAQHQVSLHEGIFSLLRHGTGQILRRHLRLFQIVPARLVQLQVQQTHKGQAHGYDEQHRRLEQRQSFQRPAGAVLGVAYGNWQNFILGKARQAPIILSTSSKVTRGTSSAGILEVLDRL